MFLIASLLKCKNQHDCITNTLAHLQPRHILLLTYCGHKLKGVSYGNVNFLIQSSIEKVHGFPRTNQMSRRTDHLHHSDVTFVQHILCY